MASIEPWITELPSTVDVSINWADQQIVLHSPTYRTENVAIPFDRQQAMKIAAFIKELTSYGN